MMLWLSYEKIMNEQRFTRAHNKWLDSPDEPTHWECNMCGGVFDGGNLTQIDNDDYWLCKDCLKEYKDVV